MSKQILVDIDDLYSIRWGINKGTESSLDYANNRISQLIEGKDSNPIPDPQPDKTHKVALVVGHNSRNKGAYAKSPIAQFEYDFNNKVADWLIDNPPLGVEFKRFNREYVGSYSREIDAVYSKVNSWNPVFALELHFNGGGGNYACMLAAETSNVSQDCAAIVQKEFVDALGISDKGVFKRGRKDRGGRSLYAAKAPIVLTEPFFGDSIDNVNKVNDIGMEEFSNIYKIAVGKVISSLV